MVHPLRVPGQATDAKDTHKGYRDNSTAGEGGGATVEAVDAGRAADILRTDLPCPIAGCWASDGKVLPQSLHS